MGTPFPSCITPAWPPPVSRPPACQRTCLTPSAISTLGTIGIAAVTWIVLGLALLTSWLIGPIRCPDIGTAGREAAAKRGLLGGSSKAQSYGELRLEVLDGEILWSEETLRIFQYDRATKPTVELSSKRFIPEDAAW